MEAEVLAEDPEDESQEEKGRSEKEEQGLASKEDYNYGVFSLLTPESQQTLHQYLGASFVAPQAACFSH